MTGRHPSGLNVTRRKDFAYLASLKEKRELVLKSRDAANLTHWGYVLSGEFPKGIKRELQRRARLQGQVKFLDAGAGLGQALAAAETASKNVQAYGLSPSTPKKIASVTKKLFGNAHFTLNPALANKCIVGHFEVTRVPDTFDVIQSFNALQYAHNKALALENLLNSLKRGGVLIASSTDIRAPLLSTSDPQAEKFARLSDEVTEQLLGTLRAQGFRISVATWHYYGDKVLRIRRGTKQANLSEFYEHRLLNNFPARLRQKKPRQLRLPFNS